MRLWIIMFSCLLIAVTGIALYYVLVYGGVIRGGIGEVSTWLYVVAACGVLSCGYGLVTTCVLLRLPTGNKAMVCIATAIQEGATAYLNRQYLTIGFVGVILVVVLQAVGGISVTFGFLVGAISSAAAGYIGMNVSVRANVRTAAAAIDGGLHKAFSTSFFSGSVTGFLVTGLGLLSLSSCFLFCYVLFPPDVVGRDFFDALMKSLIALGFGGSLISIFARLGGGIFTKGADVGADLVGKIEAGIPEDDPRNPAVIADNVGDNVGDCAGMAADLFETYVVTLGAAVVIALVTLEVADYFLMLYPLLLGAVSVIAAVIGVFFVRLGKNESLMTALYRGFFVTIFLSFLAQMALVYFVIGFQRTNGGGGGIDGNDLLACSAVGLVVSLLLVLVTEYYTGTKWKPVREIAKSSETGGATNVIQGLAIGFEATVVPAIVICVGIIVAYHVAGLYGIALAVSSMLSLCGVIVALDAYGPVTDNAGGIAKMAALKKEVRQITDTLDAVGNTTKAITKGYAIGSAGLGALVLFGMFVEDIRLYRGTAEGSFFQGLPEITFNLSSPYVIVGLILGGLLPFLFASMAMKAVGRCASAIVKEVRRQFRDIKGLMEGRVAPDYKKAVDFLTRSAIRQMIVPSLLPVLSPLLVFFILWGVVGKEEALMTLGALLLGVIVTGFFLAIAMTAGGGAWDNAKKLIEDGAFGGVGSAAHKAAVIGDTVGDPYKDTAGPAINPMIKITNIVAILLLLALSSL